MLQGSTIGPKKCLILFLGVPSYYFNGIVGPKTLFYYYGPILFFVSGSPQLEFPGLGQTVGIPYCVRRFLSSRSSLGSRA